jgi:hypothetical protein
MSSSRPRTSQVKRYKATLPNRDSYTHSHGCETYPTLRPGEIASLLDAIDNALISISRRFRVPVGCVLMIATDRDRVRRGD